MIGTFWSFVPVIIAIIIALITKRIYLALFIGAFVGCLFYCNFNPINSIGVLYQLMAERIKDNAAILIFIVLLGVIVVLTQKSGGSKAYGEWASARVKGKKGALISASLLGCLIFIDDYFNCLTVGSVMQPVTDKYKISRSKLAWIIDSTAAPVCILAPISSWAAAVGAAINGNGFVVFIETIPFNFYAWLTLGVIYTFTALSIDFPLMKKHEKLAQETGDLNGGANDIPMKKDSLPIECKRTPKVRFLLVPVIILIVCCVGCMIYTGYALNPETGLLGQPIYASNIIEAFSKCEAGIALAIGSTISLFLIVIYYAIEKAIDLKTLPTSLIEGFKIMVPAILILALGWSLSGIIGSNGGYLEANTFVANSLANVDLGWLFPALFFILAGLISFSSGNSWGTFGILIPIALAIIGSVDSSVAILTISATLGGAVFGDHVSPISDTTILSSTGASCNHMNHVRTQMPYALFAATLSFIVYLIGGLLHELNLLTLGLILIPISVVLFIVGTKILQKLLNKDIK